MKKLLLLPLAAVLCSCASTTPVATFQATSLAPVEQAVTRTEQSVQGARSAAKQVSNATAEPCKTKEWQDAYNLLTTELDHAYLGTQNAKDELKAKQTEIVNVTASANKLVVALGHERDAQKAKADAEYGKKMFWMKGFFYAVGALVLAAAWIFKKPLLAMLA